MKNISSFELEYLREEVNEIIEKNTLFIGNIRYLKRKIFSFFFWSSSRIHNKIIWLIYSLKASPAISISKNSCNFTISTFNRKNPIIGYKILHWNYYFRKIKENFKLGSDN